MPFPDTGVDFINFCPFPDVNLFSFLSHSVPSSLGNQFRSPTIHTASWRILCPQDPLINIAQLQSIYSQALSAPSRPQNQSRSTSAYTLSRCFLCPQDSEMQFTPSNLLASTVQLCSSLSAFRRSPCPHGMTSSCSTLGLHLEGTGVV